MVTAGLSLKVHAITHRFLGLSGLDIDGTPQISSHSALTWPGIPFGRAEHHDDPDIAKSGFSWKSSYPVTRSPPLSCCKSREGGGTSRPAGIVPAGHDRDQAATTTKSRCRRLRRAGVAPAKINNCAALLIGLVHTNRHPLHVCAPKSELSHGSIGRFSFGKNQLVTFRISRKRRDNTLLVQTVGSNDHNVMSAPIRLYFMTLRTHVVYESRLVATNKNCITGALRRSNRRLHCLLGAAVGLRCDSNLFLCTTRQCDGPYQRK